MTEKIIQIGLIVISLMIMKKNSLRRQVGTPRVIMNGYIAWLVKAPIILLVTKSAVIVEGAHTSSEVDVNKVRKLKLLFAQILSRNPNLV